MYYFKRYENELQHVMDTFNELEQSDKYTGLTCLFECEKKVQALKKISKKMSFNVSCI